MAVVGTTFFPCLTDIVTGKVKIEDVEYILSETYFDSREYMINIVRGIYEQQYVDDAVSIACALWDSARIYQSPVSRPDGMLPIRTWFDTEYMFWTIDRLDDVVLELDVDTVEQEKVTDGSLCLMEVIPSAGDHFSITINGVTYEGIFDEDLKPFRVIADGISSSV